MSICMYIQKYGMGAGDVDIYWLLNCYFKDLHLILHLG